MGLLVVGSLSGCFRSGLLINGPSFKDRACGLEPDFVRPGGWSLAERIVYRFVALRDDWEVSLAARAARSRIDDLAFHGTLPPAFPGRSPSNPKTISSLGTDRSTTGLRAALPVRLTARPRLGVGWHILGRSPFACMPGADGLGRNQLSEVDGLNHGLAKAEDFHSLRSWPVGGARYYLVHNDDSAVLFLNESLVGVAKFDRKLLSKKHPEKKFSRPLTSALAEGAL
ncbi:UNVERIFIED_ORG: hypothetical protein ABIB52_004500 [Arthrobacter sp. UYCu721]